MNFLGHKDGFELSKGVGGGEKVSGAVPALGNCSTLLGMDGKLFCIRHNCDSFWREKKLRLKVTFLGEKVYGVGG